MTSRRKVYGFLVLVALLAAAGYFLNSYFSADSRSAQANSKPAAEKQKPGQEATPVELATAARGKVSSFISSTTNLRALREVDVASQAEGTVREVLAEEGDFVKAGQVLCRLDDTQLQIRLQTAKQRLAQARLQSEKADVRQEKSSMQIKNGREDLLRYTKLYDEKLVSERDVALLRYKIEELEHDERVSSSESKELTHRVEELEAEIAQVNLEVARTQIKAPFGGYITQRNVNLGQSIRTMEALYKLSDFSPLHAEVFLAEAEAARVKPNQEVGIRLGADDTKLATARVWRLSPVVDQSTGTVKVTVELSGAGPQFRPGAFVRVEIKTDTRPDAVLIPKRALMEEDREHFVYLAKGESAERVNVSLGYQQNDQVEILKGVKVGDKVVVAGQGALKRGGKIKVVRS